MPPRVRVSPSQAQELAVACRLGPSLLRSLADEIESERATISQSRLSEIIERFVPSEDGKVLARLLLSLAAAISRDATKISGVLDGITFALESDFKEDKRFVAWRDCRDAIGRLLSSRSIILSAKALDVSYDFERVLAASRLEALVPGEEVNE
jgi:hypothetical protein